MDEGEETGAKTNRWVGVGATRHAAETASGDRSEVY
jgi:hypothetical protein